MVPLYAAKIEDLGPSDLVKIDCAACSHTALLIPEFLARLGLEAICGSRKGWIVAAIEQRRPFAWQTVPGDVFESLVEGEDPPTVTELAHRRTTRKVKPLVDFAGRTPEQFQAATGLIGAVEGLQQYAGKEGVLEMAIPTAQWSDQTGAQRDPARLTER